MRGRLLLLAILAFACDPGPSTGVSQQLGDHRYEVRVEVSPVVQSGSEGELSLRIRPKGERKLSVEFPTRVELESNPSVRVPGRLNVEDAALLSEPAIDFVIPLHGLAPGTTELVGELRVGVCTGDLCEPVDLPFTASLEVVP